MYYRMPCPRCRRRIEYTDLQVGHQAHCKKCNYEVILRGNPFRVTLFFLVTAAVVFIGWGGVRLIRIGLKESRHAGVVVQPVLNAQQM